VTVFDGEMRSLLTRHDVDGSLEWTRSWKGIHGFGQIAVDDSGSAFVVPPDACATVAKVSADGHLAWKAEADLDAKCDITFRVWAATEDAVYAVGQFERSRTGVVVSRFASDGTHEWTFVHDLDDESWVSVIDIATDSEGSLLATANYWEPSPIPFENSYNDVLVIKVTASGVLAWKRLFDAGQSDDALSVLVGPSRQGDCRDFLGP
jgi:hypothetical protein